MKNLLHCVGLAIGAGILWTLTQILEKMPPPMPALPDVHYVEVVNPVTIDPYGVPFDVRIRDTYLPLPVKIER